MKYLISLLPLLLLLAAVSCTPRDEVITTDPTATLAFSADTVLFDTVFVEQGSITKRLKIYNPNARAVRINEITLAGAGASPYKLIINGVESPIANNIELRGKDSLYVLVKVNINPTDENLPFLVADSILFRTNGNRQQVKLVAYGQNAYFHRKGVIGTTEWPNDKPHVLLDSVLVREGATLTIQKGTRIFAVNRSVLLVNGKLQVEGTPEERVVFSGYRREQAYAQAPGQWGGIQILTRSENNSIRYADIKNTVWGIRIGNPGKGGTLVEGCKIQYAFQDGIIAFTSDVRVVNTLIENCGQYCFAGLGGGNYEVLYSTIANYNNPQLRKTPSFVIADYIPGTEIKDKPTSLNLINTIIYSNGASNKDELLIVANQELPTLSLLILNNLIRTELYQEDLNENGNILNQDPKFKRGEEQSYSLEEQSPANGAGIPIEGIETDITGAMRHESTPDMGAYELVEE
ncbi:right-handed parallel beta-helix repeat-containing protein [Botryobacter ruber]|uniref:right-handed parallel beta-helix repeat-containing protein n=1 Tax=Botryobacter ruber TaxID=2171629 RepID=UPI000E0B6644|nr:right-handed parallel beta-helix repeat-containing protein [Botryobacter ruber]